MLFWNKLADRSKKRNITLHFSLFGTQVTRQTSMPFLEVAGNLASDRTAAGQTVGSATAVGPTAGSVTVATAPACGTLWRPGSRGSAGTWGTRSASKELKEGLVVLQCDSFSGSG